MSSCPSTSDKMHRVGKFRPEMGGFYCEQCGRFVTKDDPGIFTKEPRKPPKPISQEFYELYATCVNDEAIRASLPSWEKLESDAKGFWEKFASNAHPIAKKMVDP